MKNRLFAVLCTCMAFLGGCSSDPDIDKTTVKELDLTKFIGKWYEIARYDHSFERGLVGCTADYSFKDDGMIRVVNSGYKNSFDGKYSESVGKARRPDDSKPGQLEVAFFANFYADYWVLELDSNYTYALIGSKKDKYLWILSRTPVMDPDDLNFIKQRITMRGYSLDDLIWVEQKD